MRKRSFIAGSAAALATSLTACATRGRSDRPLNILLMTADDMDGSLPGFMGGTQNLTPNLDQLAAVSHRFINNRTLAPICQPSRQAMMTGLSPHRNGGSGFNPINEGLPTLTSLLKAQGYYTAGIHKIEHMLPAACFPWDFKVPGKDRNPLVYELGVKEAMVKASESGQPFFINCNMNDPHRPFYGSPEAHEMDHGQQGPYKIPREITPEQVTVPAFLEDLPAVRQELAQYWNSTQRLDITIGKVLKALDDSGLRDHTVVVFISDHGMPFPFSKATCYDHGTKTPFTIAWPGMGTPRIFEQLTANVDLLPTVLELVGLPIPAALDGHSLVETMRGASAEPRRYVVTEVNTAASGTAYPSRAVQDMDYSLIFCPWADGQLQLRVDGMGGLTFKAMAEAAKTDPQLAARVKQLVLGEPIAFHDLRQDPGQRVNLYHARQHQARIAEMTRYLLDEMQRSGDPQLANVQALLAGRRPVVEQDRARWRLKEGAD